MDTTTQFRTRPEGFAEVRKAHLVKTLPTIILALAVGLGLSFYQTADSGVALIVIPITITIALISVAIGLKIGLKRLKDIFDSFVLEINEQGITRKQYNTDDIFIPIGEIETINKNTDGGYTVVGRSSQNNIIIPKQMEDPDKLEAALAGVMPLTSHQVIPFLQKYRNLVGIVTMVLYVGVYLAHDKILLGTCAILLFSLLGYSFFEIQRNKNVDNTTKKTMWIIVLVGLSMLWNIYNKLIQ